MAYSIVIMGVAGCGKSSLGEAVARAEQLPLVEGDDHHSEESRDKMRRGIALTDADRQAWLDRLVAEIRARPGGLVLTCSALKRSYRDRLRSGTPGLRFVFMAINRDQSIARVAARGPRHFFHASLVDNQFQTLESPVGEPGVLQVDALEPLDALQAQVSAWLRQETAA